MDDEAFLRRFDALEIPGIEFRHADHLRLVWLCLQGASLAEGAMRFISRFQRYIEHLGAQEKYHETITWFYLVEVNRRQAAGQWRTWEAFAAANPELFRRSREQLLAHYRQSTLDSPRARETFVLPDLRAGV